eukprot:SAG31_NODE_2845_length_5009_cov_1.983299_6_plen_96_part_00
MLEVVLFYKYVRLPDVTAVATEQERWCLELKLTGRLRLAGEGINGLLAGPSQSLEVYRKRMNGAQYAQFAAGKRLLTPINDSSQNMIASTVYTTS